MEYNQSHRNCRFDYIVRRCKSHVDNKKCGRLGQGVSDAEIGRLGQSVSEAEIGRLGQRVSEAEIGRLGQRVSEAEIGRLGQRVYEAGIGRLGQRVSEAGIGRLGQRVSEAGIGRMCASKSVLVSHLERPLWILPWLSRRQSSLSVPEGKITLFSFNMYCRPRAR